MSNGNINAKQIKGVLEVENGGTGNPTYSNGEIITFGTQSMVSSGYQFNDLGTASTDIWSAEQIITNQKQLFNLAFGRNNSNVTNSFLKGPDGVFSDLSPYIIPYDCNSVNISAGTNGIYTWEVQLFINGVLSTSLNITADNKGFNTISVPISAGDGISVYCLGTSINRPNVLIWVEK